MTYEERIEALLNRAGETISDLPEITAERRAAVLERSRDIAGDYARACDILDRLEAALDRAVGALDFAAAAPLTIPCELCQYTNDTINQEPCRTCAEGDRRESFQLLGAPEYWNADQRVLRYVPRTT